ncbi:MAG: type III-B CRISPR-associated protein Cas10/Cmr2 [Chitinivibrionales bacterium]|nr:type III-B CRISPR-associated protein Cas10/Cmr2 [Chitinivibrionales bacterium]
MKRQSNYWQNKVSLFLHDPVHKALKIPGHEERSFEIAEALVQSKPEKDFYGAADQIATSLTRAALPGYSKEETENGAVDFTKDPVLTHPLVADAAIGVNLTGAKDIEDIHEELVHLLMKDLGYDLDVERLNEIPEIQRPLNGFFNKNNSPEDWAQALFNYLFFAFRKRLRKENIGGLGALWDVLPADTRIPDHSIWHHCGLTSAIGSAMAEDPDHEVSLAVFSITPVQLFIAKAKKLRDSWTASFILSYLSFIGIRTVIRNCGPDHIVYPSLHDQWLVEKWLEKEYHLERYLNDRDVIKKHSNAGKTIASFPNKFVFLCATAQVEETAHAIEQEIQKEWLRIAGLVRDYIERNSRFFRELFDHQVSDYWNYSWSSAKLTGLDDMDDIAVIVPKEKWSNEARTIEKFAAAFADSRTTARLYGATHSLVQSLLASEKLKPVKIRKAQNGEKCPLCGEHEVLHDFAGSETTKARVYSDKVNDFWDRQRTRFNSKTNDSTAQLGEKERICAICAVKRFLPLAMKWEATELLHEVFTKVEKFPSTTELAMKDYLRRLKGMETITREECPRLVAALHESELEGGDDEHSKAVREIINEGDKKGVKLTNRDKYYAVLLMDGDKMGDLINGETIAARWQDILHPELVSRFNTAEFKKKFVLGNHGLEQKRIINPAVHAAISDALNSFARFAVAPLFPKSESDGKLVYAGGDDVCAVLPLDTALEIAEKINRAYRMKFVTYNETGAVELCEAQPGATKIGMHLGGAEKITISAALIIAHHKEPLREVFRDAHAVLAIVAKENAGRNALAIRLKKRSGSDRDIAFQWDRKNPFLENETLLESFKRLMESVSEHETSSGLVYRIKQLEDVVRPLVAKSLVENREKVVDIFAYEVGHSGLAVNSECDKEKNARKRTMAARLAGLCVLEPSSEPDWFNPEGVVIARFLASKKEDDNVL